METNGLRAAIEKIEDMAQKANTQKFEINGEMYSTEHLYKIEKEYYIPKTIELNTLKSLGEIIKTELEKMYKPLFVRVSSPTLIETFTTYHNEEDCRRDYLYRVQADLPQITLNSFVSHEQFMIALRSKFIETEDVEYLLNLLAKITDKNSVESEDNGLTQTVQAKKGVVMVENVAVRPKVTLKPYRTFLEVEQPESEFLLRLKEGGHIGLFEADGGAWKLDAKKNIKCFLEKELNTEIKKSHVIVIA